MLGIISSPETNLGDISTLLLPRLLKTLYIKLEVGHNPKGEVEKKLFGI